MPHIPEEIIEQIRQRANLVEVASNFMELRHNGHRHTGLCPFHNEKTPSFSIDEEKQLFYCFGCKKSGNIFRFVQEIINTDFVGATKWLANRLNIVIPEEAETAEQRRYSAERKRLREDGYRLLENASLWFQGQLNREGAQKARDYLADRGLDTETIAKFSIGYAPDSWDAFRQWALDSGYSDDMLLKTGMTIRKEDNPDRCYDRFRDRLVFTIKDELQRVVGFSARILTSDHQAAKYVNSPESDFFKKGEILYGLFLAQKPIQTHGFALVCEGQMDVIACHRAGLNNAVAAQGTAFTANHATLLKRSTNKVKLAFDGDEAGLKATFRTIGLLQEVGITVSIVTIPNGEDPDSIFRLGGAEALQQIMSQDESAISFAFRKACEKYDLNLPEGKSAISSQVLEIISTISDDIARTAHCQWLARQMQLPESLFLSNLSAILQRKRRAEDNRQNYRRLAPESQDGSNPNQPPPFIFTGIVNQNQGNENAWTALLDLTLRYQPLAQNLVQDQELLQLIPDIPLGHALTQLVSATEQGEWELCMNDLATSELSADPIVGKILFESQFDKLNPDTAPDSDKVQERQQALQRAFSDCRKRILSAEYSQQLAELNQQLKDNPNLFQEILPKISALQTRKRNL